MDGCLYNGSVSLRGIRLYQPGVSLYAGYSDVHCKCLVQCSGPTDKLTIRTCTRRLTKNNLIIHFI